MYVSNGETFVYTSPKPQTFVRAGRQHRLHRRRHGRLEEWPAAGTHVVTVGAAELFGAEASGGK